MKEYKTKHGGYKIETIESSDGTVDVHVGKTGLLKTTSKNVVLNDAFNILG